MTARFRFLSSAMLRELLAVLDVCPRWVPGAVDVRIAARNELWARETAAERESAWLVAAIRSWN